MKKLLRSRPFRYLLSGGTSFAVENASFILLFYAASLHYTISNVTSVLIALLVNFVLTKYFVFQSKNKGQGTRQALMYGVLVIINITISTFLIGVLIDMDLPAYIAKVCVTILIAIWTYVIYKTVIFRTR